MPKGPDEPAWKEHLSTKEMEKIMAPFGGEPGQIPSVETKPEPEPDAPIEVEPEPELEITIDGEPAPTSEEEPIVVDLEQEPLVEPAPTEAEASHEKMVEDLLQLHAEIYRARYQQEPDEKSLQKYRALYGRQTDELLQKQAASLTQELQGAGGQKAA